MNARMETGRTGKKCRPQRDKLTGRSLYLTFTADGAYKAARWSKQNLVGNILILPGVLLFSLKE
jgi:hypothetical protein